MGPTGYPHNDFDMSKPERASSLYGTLDLLALKSLSLEPLHGVGVMQRIEQITSGSVRVSYGSLFPSLHRMEQKGWLVAEWRASDSNRRAKYYALTPEGRKRLRLEEREWSRLVEAISTALRST
jgi:PadR family transcriptional regulator, regulatory protein PadR